MFSSFPSPFFFSSNEHIPPFPFHFYFQGKKIGQWCPKEKLFFSGTSSLMIYKESKGFNVNLKYLNFSFDKISSSFELQPVPKFFNPGQIHLAITAQLHRPHNLHWHFAFCNQTRCCIDLVFSKQPLIGDCQCLLLNFTSLIISIQFREKDSKHFLQKHDRKEGFTLMSCNIFNVNTE